jgi:hypothetical protein
MVDRYDPVLKHDDGSCFDIGSRPLAYVEMDKWDSGKYVLHEDYAKLEAENKTLKSNRIGEVRTVLMEELGYKIDALEAENKALKVEFEVLKDSNSTLKNRISNALKTSEDLRNDLL